jgi:hypothetical protein
MVPVTAAAVCFAELHASMLWGWLAPIQLTALALLAGPETTGTS